MDEKEEPENRGIYSKFSFLVKLFLIGETISEVKIRLSVYLTCEEGF